MLKKALSFLQQLYITNCTLETPKHFMEKWINIISERDYTGTENRKVVTADISDAFGSIDQGTK